MEAKRERGFAIGRITFVPPSLDEIYYLRVLLNKVVAPISFEAIKTVDGVLYPKFKDACYAYGLLDDDKEFIEAIKEASHWGTGRYLRRLFAMMLYTNSITKPSNVWAATCDILSEDMLYEERKIRKKPDLQLTTEQIRSYGLAEIEKLLRLNSCTLKKFTDMPLVDVSLIGEGENILIRDEKSYDRDYLSHKHEEWMSTITDEQKSVYTKIMTAVDGDLGGMFFVHGFGGTGKTFLWSILGAAIRSIGDILLNVASSGIAALLLLGGRTAHSRFGIPIVVHQTTTCSITADSDVAQLIRECKLIIWDEAPMMSKYCFETLDRSMRDILKCEKPFGGKVIVFGGDFRHILPVIPGGGRVETVLASLNSSKLWKSCIVLQLTKNMRLSSGLNKQDSVELASFSKWILAIGDGKINPSESGESEIEIPEDLLILDNDEPVKAIIKDVYGETFSSRTDPEFYQQRAILSPRNQDVDMINDLMLSQLSGGEKTYLSSDSIDISDTSSTDDMVYSEEFLNSVKVSGLPNHCLRLRVGAPIMLLRNIDPTGGLCNGTRLLITRLADHVIEAKIITGERIGERVSISRMFVSPPDAKFPFRMRRRQFPVTVAFAMTINKSQGQTLKTMGLYLPKPVFTHGQLYVAVSRITFRKGLKILIMGKDGKPARKTTNVVYTEIFENIYGPSTNL